MDVNTVYNYSNLIKFQWNLNETQDLINPGNTGSFRKIIDWGTQDLSNRAGVYLIADPNNTCNIRFFLSQRTAAPPTTGSLLVTEPIVEEVDSYNRSRRLFPIGKKTPLYCEPTIYNGPSGPSGPVQILYIYQVTGVPIKYYGV